MGLVLGILVIFFGGGTVFALTLCGSSDDADRRIREALDAETEQLEREANELVLR